MWYPTRVTTAPATEPVSLLEVKAQATIDAADDDTLIIRMIKAARAFAEQYCARRFITQTVTIECDAFDDMARFPEAPLASVTTIKYFDTDGVEQTLPDTVYQLRKDGLEPSIALKSGQSWPNIQQDSRITTVAVVGADAAEEDVKHAILLWIADGYDKRENDKPPSWSVFDSLLINHRRNA